MKREDVQVIIVMLITFAVVMLFAVFPMCDRHDQKIIDMKRGMHHERNHYTYPRPEGTDRRDKARPQDEPDEDLPDSR